MKRKQAVVKADHSRKKPKKLPGVEQNNGKNQRPEQRRIEFEEGDDPGKPDELEPFWD